VIVPVPVVGAGPNEIQLQFWKSDPVPVQFLLAGTIGS